MSLFPALASMLLVMMLAVSSVRVVQDAGLLAAQRRDAHMARQRADLVLHRMAAALAAEEPTADEAAIEEVPTSDQAELGDLPLLLHRVTVTGRGHQARVRLQADYAVDGCESEDDEPCVPRVKRIAWRELSE